MGAHHEEVAALLARADLIMLAVPLSVIPELATATLAGKIVLDCINPTAAESVALAPLLAGRSTSRYVADHFPGARLVKAFNTLPAHLLLGPTRRRQGAPRYALPVTADDEPAKKVVLRMVAAAGFAPLDAGTLAGSWRLQIGQPAYGQLAEEPELVRLLVGATPARPLIQAPAEDSGPASARPPGSPGVDPLAPFRPPGESYLRGLMQHETEF
jgi:predicted dinucleotide-binding enzyme